MKHHLTEMGLPVRALLLLDNAPAHPDEEKLKSSDGAIKAMYLPPNTTALIQPMDQGVLEAMKRRYKKLLLQKLLFKDQSGNSMVEFVKTVSLKDVVQMIVLAWEDVPASTLTKSGFKLLGRCLSPPDSTPTNESCQEPSCEQLLHHIDATLSSDDISEWLHSDSEDPGYQLLSDADIIQQVTQEEADNEGTCSDDDDSLPTETIPTNGQVADMLDQCMKWYECQNEATAPSLMLLTD